jgi:ribosomal subunit interface protein
MVDIKISGRKVSVSDGMRDRVTEKIGDALKVFDIQPMNCDVVLRMGRNRTKPERTTCEVTVFVRHNVVRVEANAEDMYTAIDEAASKVSRQLRKYKTRVVDRRQRSVRSIRTNGATETPKDLSSLIESPEDDDNQLVREKVIELTPMTEEEALIQTDLLGHDFYVFMNSTTGLINVIYHRNNGGYGIIKPKDETKGRA